MSSDAPDKDRAPSGDETAKAIADAAADAERNASRAPKPPRAKASDRPPAKAAHADEGDADHEDEDDHASDDHELPPASSDTIARRQLLGKMSIAMSCAGGVALGVPVVGFIVAPLFRGAPREWRPVGKVETFKVGHTVNVVFEDASPLPWAGVTSRTAAWLRRVSETEFEAFSVNCAHLGCPVRWMPDARLFMCPCHGGVYYEDGTVAAGPPPHPLPQYPVRVNNGVVEIRTDPIPIG